MDGKRVAADARRRLSEMKHDADAAAVEGETVSLNIRSHDERQHPLRPTAD